MKNDTRMLGPTGGGLGSWRGLAAALGERLFMGLDASQLYADALMAELGTEVEVRIPTSVILRPLQTGSCTTPLGRLSGDCLLRYLQPTCFFLHLWRLAQRLCF